MDPIMVTGIAAGFAALGGVIAALGKIIHTELTECKIDRAKLHEKVNTLSSDLTNVWKAMANEANKPVEVLKNGH